MADEMNVRRMAELAKLTLSSEEELRLSREMEGILVFARQLQELEIDGAPQTQHILTITNVLREDAAGPCLTQEEVLSAAPAREDVYIAVPRTVE